MKTALVIGASGLVGGHVVSQLLNEQEFSSISILTRKPLHLQHPKLKEILVDFDNLENFATRIKADCVFCCLGTTIKTAGTQAAFRKVDFEYPLKVAEIAKQNGTTTFILISALGASKNSFIFYNRVKGEIEEAIGQLQFDCFHILQPSLIIGERKDTRLGEGIAQKLSPVYDMLMFGPLSKYKSIKAEQIAKAMVEYAKSDGKGVFRHDSGALQQV